MAPLNVDGLRAAVGERSGDPFVWLVEITHPQLEDPLRLTDNQEPIASRGRLFMPARVRVALPEQIRDRPARVRLVLEDVLEELRAELRALSPHDAPRVTLEIVLAGSPDVTQRAFRDARLTSATFDPISVEAELSARSALSRAAPWQTFSRDRAPAVHRFLAAT